MAVDPAPNGYLHQLTGLKENIKQYFVYDMSSRMSIVYEARANASDGSPCLKTTYTYVSTSTRVQAMKEEDSTWSSAWDI